jgi:hypothetical protein
MDLVHVDASPGNLAWFMQIGHVLHRIVGAADLC